MEDDSRSVALKIIDLVWHVSYRFERNPSNVMLSEIFFDGEYGRSWCRWTGYGEGLV